MSQGPNPFDVQFAVPSDSGFPAGPTPDWPRGRWWSPVLVVIASLVTFFFASGVMIVVACIVVHGEFNQRILTSSESMMAVSSSRIGLLLLVGAPQVALLLPSLLAASLSPERIGQRLSLVRGHWPIWAWFAAAAVTPLVGWISSVVVGSFMEESENLQMMSEVFRSHGRSGFLIPLALLIGVTPAICEELLFRGYVQTRLNVSFGPVIGIVASSLLFAVFHLDPVHVVAVLPLGLFLGCVAWRSGSLLPAMLGHFVNNAVSVVTVVLAPADADSLSPAMDNFLTLVLIGGAVGFFMLVYAWREFPLPCAGRDESIAVGIPAEAKIGAPGDGSSAV